MSRLARLRQWYHWLGWLSLGASLVGVHAVTDLRTHQNSDLYYLPALYEDLASWSGHLTEWKLPPAPYFFPDMPLYFAVQSLLANHALAFVLAGVAQTVLHVFGWLLVMLSLNPPRARRPLIYGMVLLTNALLLWLPGPNIATPLLLSTHFGVILMIPYALALSIRLLGRGLTVNRTLAALGLWSVACLLYASDALSLVQLVAPLIVSVALVAIASHAYFRGALTVAVCLAAGSAAGGWLARLVIVSDSAGPYTTLRLDRLASSLRSFLDWVLALAQGHALAMGLVVLAVCLHVALLVVWLFSSTETRRAHAAVALISLFALLSVLATLLATLLAGNTFTARYLLPLFFIPLASLPAALIAQPRWHAVAQAGFPVAATGLLLFASWQSLVTGQSLARYAGFHPDWVACIDDRAADRNLTVGLADYWDAKYFTVLSQRGVKLLQVAPNMEPFPWISNIKWYARWLPDFVVARTDSQGGRFVAEN